MLVFYDFYNHKLDLIRINFGVIALLPKGGDADIIWKFRPICLLQVLFKIFSKSLIVRADPIMPRVVSHCQTAFIQGRNIMDGVLLLHEILRESKLKKQKGVVPKIDFENAYDEVNWTFLFDCVEKKGF